MRMIFLGLVVFCLDFQPRVSSAATGGTPRPNVLFILADQWRAQAFGFAGDPNVKTPHLDSLATEGIMFSNAVSGVPVCCPARASLLTGQRSTSTGVFMNDVPLKSDRLTIAEVLAQHGYDTAYVGKWHLDGHGRSNFIPRERRQGFDYWKVLECTHAYNRSKYFADSPEPKLWEGYDAIAQTRDVAQYLKGRARQKRPFFMFLSWGPPHDPYQTAPEEFQKLYLPERIQLRPNVPKEQSDAARKMLAGYYAHCTALDECVGDLRATLRTTGLETNTLLVFTSDHGDMLGSHGGRNKQQPYDESIRVPLIVRWPAGLGSKGRMCGGLFNSEDMMPTLLSLCGIPIPKSVEGLDFSSCMKGGADPSGGAALIACVTPFGQWDRKNGGHEYRGIRTGRYTYVRDLEGPWLLFDNVGDPWQTNNLARQSSHGKLQRRLDVLLARKLRAAGDEFKPGADYIHDWGYAVTPDGTVPYTN